MRTICGLPLRCQRSRHCLLVQSLKRILNAAYLLRMCNVELTIVAVAAFNTGTTVAFASTVASSIAAVCGRGASVVSLLLLRCIATILSHRGCWRLLTQRPLSNAIVNASFALRKFHVLYLLRAFARIVLFHWRRRGSIVS